MNILGLTLARLRTEAIKLLGPTVVGIIEKLVEYVQTLWQGGVAGLWAKIKEDLTNLKDMAVDAIQSWLVSTIIKQGTVRLATLFNPAGAIIQAIIAIYNTIQVVIERISQIAAFIAAVINSIAAIASGAISGAIKWIENALAGAIPLAISFLAGLIGLGGVSKKVREFLVKAGDLVWGAIRKWIKKGIEYVKKLFGIRKKDKPDKAPVVKEQFAMGPEGHTVTGRIKGNSVEITMASSADIALGAQLSHAMTEIENDKNREKSQKKAIKGHLSAAKARVDGIRAEYESEGKPEAFDKFMKPRLAKIIGYLNRLAKYDPPITSLQHIISQGKPRYIPKGYKIRKNLYDHATGGKWTSLSQTLKTSHVSKISAKLYAIWILRDNKNNPNNYATAKSQWDNAQAMKEIPVKKAPTFASYDHLKHFSTFKYETDHKIPLGTFWNSGEKNEDDAKRSATTVDLNNLAVLTKEENKAKSGIRFDRDVGPNFSSVCANSPKGSKTISGIPFDE